MPREKRVRKVAASSQVQPPVTPERQRPAIEEEEAGSGAMSGSTAEARATRLGILAKANDATT
jgi:hypothetical protein